MKIKSAEFVRSATNLDTCPSWHLPEFAFIGRSNVGKSTLINLLTERRDLARVSGTPGKTQLMNFYRIDGTWALVDLPGYGFARLAKGKRFGFNEAAADYLEGRPNLRCVFVLLDSRLPPQPIDLEFVRWLATTRVHFAYVFTKIDKQSATQTSANVALIVQALAGIRPPPPETFLCSSISRQGRAEILRFIQGARQES